MSFYSEFKTFISRGNVIDMAVGVIVGVAFGQVVSSLVKEILMPPIGLMIGRVDLSAFKLQLSPDASINYGVFISTVVNFILVMLAIFLLVKMTNKLNLRKEVIAPKAKECPQCLMSIPEKAKRCGHCTSAL